jgi:hypothetical protein
MPAMMEVTAPFDGARGQVPVSSAKTVSALRPGTPLCAATAAWCEAHRDPAARRNREPACATPGAFDRARPPSVAMGTGVIAARTLRRRRAASESPQCIFR